MWGEAVWGGGAGQGGGIEREDLFATTVRVAEYYNIGLCLAPCTAQPCVRPDSLQRHSVLDAGVRRTGRFLANA